MSYEIMVGIEVKDDAVYNQYREAMTPLLKEVNGGFRYDFKVSETLQNEEGRPINRVFAIYFESQEMSKKFFSNPEYLKIREKYFEPSVGARTTLSSYERA